MLSKSLNGLYVGILALGIVAFLALLINFVIGDTGQQVLALVENDKESGFAGEKPAEDPLKGETAWGFQVAKVMYLAFPNADIALITGSELLSISPYVAEGDPIPWEKLRSLDIVLAEIKGEELISAVASSVKLHPRKNTNFLQIFGAKVLCVRMEDVTKVSRITIDDKVVVPDKIYRVVMTKFLAEGGGPFVGAKSIKVISEPVSLQLELRKRLFPYGRVQKPEPVYFFSKPED